MNIKHVAIILDGNRRWAKQRGMLPQLGHKEGAKVLEQITKDANKIGLEYLTVYVFSTENWKRSKTEVNYLMNLFKVYFNQIMKSTIDEGIKINFFGTDEGLSKSVKDMKYKVMEKTKDSKGLQLNLCFNYGGRDEIKNAFIQIAEKVKSGELNPEDITEDIISNHLYSKNIPDPDLVIRTSGEQRISNFLPWQSTYSELLFDEKYWPDYTIEDLKEAIENFESRERRFGGK